jgi:hypothetical protein
VTRDQATIKRLRALLAVAGEMSEAARRVCGGKCFATGGYLEAANLNSASVVTAHLRLAVDAYDRSVQRFEDSTP